MDDMELNFTDDDLKGLGELVESLGIDVQAIEEKTAAMDDARSDSESGSKDEEWEIDMKVFLELENATAKKAG